MARLNEPGASPETLESLKRKFIRQNRDLARVNSTQSMRIRELENEISKLLSENLSLRGQILRLQSDQENRQVRRFGEQTFRLKALLESKLLEISALVGDLGQEVKQHKVPPKRGKNRYTGSVQSPKETWVNFYSECESVPSPDGRLPPILEDPSYLRRKSEIQDVCNQAFAAEIFSTESPEIGSPPRLQFVDADPVKIDLPINTEDSLIEEPRIFDPTLSITVEQRRKKKDSLGSADVKRQDSITVAPEKKENTGSLRSGAKRKLSVREDEERAVEVSADKKEAASRERKAKLLTNVTPTVTVDEQRLAIKNGIEAKIRKSAKSPSPCTRSSREKQNLTERKALAPKNINVSPKKRNLPISGLEKPNSDMTLNIAQKKVRNSEKIQHIDVFREPLSETVLEITEIPGETNSEAKLQVSAESKKSLTVLAALPASSPVNRLEVTPTSLDVAPPLTDNCRPSRRVRGSVSYAEPNLRHKMRRPTKKLADAIIRDDFSQSRSQPVNLCEVKEGNITTPDSKTYSIQSEATSPSTFSEIPSSRTVSGEDDSSCEAPKDIPPVGEENHEISSDQTSATTTLSKSSVNHALAKNKDEQTRLNLKTLECNEDKNDMEQQINKTRDDTSSPQLPFSEIKSNKKLKNSSPDSMGLSTDSVPKKSAEGISRRRRRSTLAIRSASTITT